MSKNEAELFNEHYIEKLYKEYLNVKIDSTPAFDAITQLCNQRTVLVLAPGSSIKNYAKEIHWFIANEKPVVFSVNFVPSDIDVDIIFCSNGRRLDNIATGRKQIPLLITFNLIDYASDYNYVISYNDVAYCAESYCEDSTVMLLNALVKCRVLTISVAGFDGSSNGKMSFFDEYYEKNTILTTS